MTVIMLLASNSYAITSHFCGTELVAISFTGKSLSCAMETTGDDCDSNKSVKKDCCSDEVKIIESQDFNKVKDIKFTQKQLEFTAAFVITYHKLFQETTLEKDFYKDFSPPDIIEDYQVLYETFLI